MKKRLNKIDDADISSQSACLRQKKSHQQEDDRLAIERAEDDGMIVYQSGTTSTYNSKESL